MVKGQNSFCCNYVVQGFRFCVWVGFLLLLCGFFVVGCFFFKPMLLGLKCQVSCLNDVY